jgi:hypothetical protein
MEESAQVLYRARPVQNKVQGVPGHQSSGLSMSPSQSACLGKGKYTAIKSIKSIKSGAGNSARARNK